MVVKYLRENIGQEICSKKGIYACLAGIAGSRDQRSVAVKPRLPTLPIHKQNNKAQINNSKTTFAMHTHDDMAF